MLLRRPPERLTYGWGWAESSGDSRVVLIILFSVGYAGYESSASLITRPPGYLAATAVWGVVGFLGNEWVAVYRIRSGRRIGSVALIADRSA